MTVVAEPGVLDALYEHILDGDPDLTKAKVDAGLREGVEPTVLLYESMIPALEEVGRLFETEVYFLPEMLVSATAMKAGMEVLRPHLADGHRDRVGKFVIGTVAGDIHDIGKNMCVVMLEGAGFEVVDLGVNVTGTAFVAAIQEHQPHIVGMSAFLTTTVPEIGLNMLEMEEAGVRDAVKVMVGGAPVNEHLAREVGADGYAPDASSAARTAKAIVGDRNS